MGVISALLLFHFTGIFTATSSPGTGALPPPWLVEQAFGRVFNPYLQFVYLRNAYHFYSPEPGPASLVCCLLKTETGSEVRDGVRQPTYEYRWVILPRRPADVKDPLGLTYYRRLSVTEQVARMYPGLAVPSDQFEKSEVRQRRVASGIPLVPVSGRDRDQPISQYRIPNQDIQRYVIPSYARFVLLEYTAGGQVSGKTTVKMYRLEHQTLDVGEFTGVTQPEGKPVDPYHPATYRPYFLGEFGWKPDPDHPGVPRVELLNPQEPMLYWLVPVIPRPEGSPPGPDGKDYIDFLSQHAGVPPGQEFPWGQLR
jgi:hypothetical protein